MDILILHGWKASISSSEAWYSPLITHLKKKKHVVYAPDLPGFGSCQRPERPFSVSDYAEWVSRYIQKNKLKKPLVIGHSFGGRVAIKLFAQHPNQVNTLVLTGVPGYPPASNKKIATLKIIAKLGGSVFTLPLLTILSSPARKLFYKLIGAWDYYHANGIMRETFKIVIVEDLIKAMKEIRAKTTLIWGAEDTITPVWIGERMKKTIANAQLTVIPLGSHMVLIDRPKEFVNAIRL